MLENYLKVAWRHLVRHKAYMFINITGLAVGMACALLILLYVQDELSYDQYHEQADQIYRVTLEVDVSGEVFSTARTTPPMAAALRNDFPDVLNAFRIRKVGSVLLARNEHRFYEERFYFADPSIFDVLDVPLVEGNAATALDAPFSVVLTQEAARIFFGEDDPIGQTLTFEREHPLTVTGILAPVSVQSHFQPALLASFSSLETLYGDRLQNWGWTGVHTYLLLSNPKVAKDLEAKLPVFIERNIQEDWAGTWHLGLQPITEIHLYSHRSGELEANGDIRSSYFLGLLGLFVLLIACINFVNLTTARSVDRVREIGVRKVIGAHRTQLVQQFIGESILLTLLALGLSFLLVNLSLSTFNMLTGKTLNLAYSRGMWASFLGLGLLVGLVAGLYPALFLARLQPVASLRSKKAGAASLRLRQGLVVTQFAISAFLIIGTLIVSSQLDYLRNKDLGFEEEQVVVIPMQDATTQQRYQLIKDVLRQSPDIISVAASSDVPGQGYDQIVHRPEGFPANEGLSIPILFVDPDFIQTLGIEMVAGRSFSSAQDESTSFIVNEAAVHRFGWDIALGKTISDAEGNPLGTVVGVANNFHFESLQATIEPLLMRVQPDWFEKVIVRTHPSNVPGTLDFLEQQWQSFEPGYPFQYSFLDEDFQQLYQTEDRLHEVFSYTSLLAILIACLGLFGLAAFTAEQRTKEIGIRKVLGASVPGIVLLLSKDFLKLVALALVLAAPIGYLAMSRWLNDFAYRVDLGVGTFVLAGALALLIAVLTVSYQAIKAALSDPVKSLRYE